MATPAALVNQQLLAQGAIVDQTLIQQGLAAGQAQRRAIRPPSLFDQVSAGLFSTGVANPERAAALQEKLSGPFAEGIFGKRGARLRSEAASEQFEENRAAFLAQAEAAGVSITPELEAQIDQQLDSNLGFAGAQEVIAQAQAELPEAVAARQAGARAQGVQRAQAEVDLLKSQQELLASSTPQALALQAANQRNALIEAQGGRFGSGLTFPEFQGVASQVGGLVQGSGTLRGLSDIVESTTPAQLALLQSGELRGKVQADIFSLLRPLQTLLEDKASVLRESDRRVIEEIIGNPASFISGVTTRDPVITGKLNELASILERNTAVALQGLDATTIGLLDASLTRPDRPFQQQEGTIREPVSGLTPEQERLGETSRARGAAVGRGVEAVQEFLTIDIDPQALGRGGF